MENNNKILVFKVVHPIINCFFFNNGCFSKGGSEGGGMHRLCTPAYSSGLTIRNSPEDLGRFESSPPRLNTMIKNYEMIIRKIKKEKNNDISPNPPLSLPGVPPWCPLLKKFVDHCIKCLVRGFIRLSFLGFYII